MRIGHRKGTKNFTIHIAIPEWGYWETSLRTSNRETAERRADEVERLVDQGRKPDEIKKILIWMNSTYKKKEEDDITFEKFCNRVLEYIKDKKKSYESFHKRCAKHLIKHFGEMKLNKITTLDVINYQKLRIAEVKGATVNREVGVLRMIINLAIKWGDAITNPVKGVEFYKELKGRIRFLEIEEINHLIENCSEWLKQIVIVAVHTGMRIGEILGLRKDNIDFRNGFIIIEKTKNDEVRDIPMSKAVREIFLERIKNNACDIIFHTSNNTALRYRNVYRTFQNTLKKSEIKNFRIHDLRHTFASQFIMSGGDLYTLSKILGHKDVKTTMIYAHLTLQHKQQAINRMEQYLNGHNQENSDSFRTVGQNGFYANKSFGKQFAKSA